MNVEIPMYRLAGAPALLDKLRRMEGADPKPNTLLLVSVGMLPTSDAPPEFWQERAVALVKFARQYNGEVFAVSETDCGLVVEMSDLNRFKMVSELKVLVLRLIQRFFAESFGGVDQTRLVRIIDLRSRLAKAIHFLERAVSQSAAPKKIGGKLHRLCEDDIKAVVRVNKKMGRSRFAQTFISSQSIAAMLPGESPKMLMNEYFVGMDKLKKFVFTQVELRGAGNLFNQLTVILDRLLLRAYDEIAPAGGKCSINLNVESVFTAAFEAFLSEGGEERFARLVFEFRQADVLQHYDQFVIACDLIRSQGGSVAIDAIFPETLGIVNLGRLNANIAKIFWRSGAEAMLPEFKREISDMRQSGVVPVLARLDDETGISIGHDLGITMFQGFYVDGLIAQKAA